MKDAEDLLLIIYFRGFYKLSSNELAIELWLFLHKIKTYGSKY